MKRSTLRRSALSRRSSIACSRCATWAPTGPSGWPARGSPHASPARSSGASTIARSRSVSGSNPLTSCSMSESYARPTARRIPGITPDTRLLDPLGDPAAVWLAGEHDPDPVLGADSHQMSTVLLDARPVVHQHELERVPVEPRPLGPESPPGGLVEELPVPTPILSPRLLERPISRSHIGRKVLPRKPPPRSDEPEHKEHDGEDADNDQNDCKYGHGPESRSTLKARPKRPAGLAPQKHRSPHAPEPTTGATSAPSGGWRRSRPPSAAVKSEAAREANAENARRRAAK